MRKWRKDAGLFAAGAIGYSLLEVACRGYTHWTMALTGGMCAMGLYRIHRRIKQPALRCLAGAGLITLAELTVGLIVNRLLHWNVWDYSDRYMNVLGQICPRFTAYWFLLNIPLIPVFRAADRLLGKDKNTVPGREG